MTYDDPHHEERRASYEAGIYGDAPAPRKPATRKLCEECGASFYNLHAHLEECPGPVGFERVEFQCGKCLRTENRSVWCHGMWMSRVSPGAYRHPSPRPL